MVGDVDGFGLVSVITLMTVDLHQDIKFSKSHINDVGEGEERAL